MSSEDMHLCCSLQPMRMRLITRETGVGKRPVFCRKMPPLLLTWSFPSVTGLVQRTPMVESLLGSSRGFHVTPGHYKADSPPACLTPSYAPRLSQSPMATLGRQKLEEGTPEFTPNPSLQCQIPERNLIEMQILGSVLR